jgi:antitoxin CcdA
MLKNMRIDDNMSAFRIETQPMPNPSPLAPNPPRKATNVSLTEALVAEARALRINISQAAETGITRAVAEKRAELWLESNREALASSNAFVEQNGLPLARYRGF